MTTIGPSLVITGDITCQEDITIHGRVSGQVTMAKGALVIAPSGNVDAMVQGSTITIHGTIKGDVVATGRVELSETATVTGTVRTPALVVKEGATLNGSVDMATKKVDAARPVVPAAAPASTPAAAVAVAV